MGADARDWRVVFRDASEGGFCSVLFCSVLFCFAPFCSVCSVLSCSVLDSFACLFACLFACCFVWRCVAIPCISRDCVPVV